MNSIPFFNKKRTPFTLSIYCDGDSTTAYPDNYTGGIKAYLESNVEGLTATVNNISVSGQTAAQMLLDLDSQVLANNPDIVSVSTCLNDTGDSTSALRSVLTQYVDKVTGHVNPNGVRTRLLLMTDNACGQNLTEPYARPESVQIAYKNVVLGVISDYRKNPYLWGTDRFKAYYDLGFESAEFFAHLRADDKVHPNDLGFSTIDEPLIYPVLRNIAEDLRKYK